MTIIPSDLSLVYSGGTNNNDPNLALGGASSSFRVSSDVINNLFDDVQPEESTDGQEDYRCLYFFNDSGETCYNVTMWIADEEVGGSTIEVGVNATDEFQRIVLSGGSITGGALKISFADLVFVTDYNADLGDWANDIQTKLRGLGAGLSDVVVTAQNAGGGVTIFDVAFGGEDGKRAQPDMLIFENALEPSSIEAAVTVLQGGSPINTLAPEIEVEGNQPPDV
jgi:hypothetical protein